MPDLDLIKPGGTGSAEPARPYVPRRLGDERGPPRRRWRRRDRPEQNFGQPETWDEISFRDRADDIVHLVAALSAIPEWRNRVDWQRFGLVGHSLGGYTVLGLSDAWPSWKLDRVKAVLALSPYIQPFLVRGTPAGLGAPVMYRGGTLDFGITPALHRESIRVVSGHAKTRQKHLAVGGAAQLCGARHEARRNAAQPRNDRTRFIEPSHMDIARGENAV